MDLRVEARRRCGAGHAFDLRGFHDGSLRS
jgi:uncharacterized protein (DUF885 family)